MADEHVALIKDLLSKCSVEERYVLFKGLRAEHQIHEFEQVIGAPAEMILEAIHRAPELTRRMLRGVIADAAFFEFIVPLLYKFGWKDATPVGNFSYDYKLEDTGGPVTVQVKLQRSEKGSPAVKDGLRYGFDPTVFMVETQKTRGGTGDDDKQTRPYRYGEFDILAVSMQPSTGKWNRFMYTVGRWLIQRKNPDEIATMQPVAMTPNVFWTDDFNIAAQWFRADAGRKRIKIQSITPPKKRRVRKSRR